MKAELTDPAKNFWDLIISVLTVAGAVAGGIFAMVQYLDATQKDRVGHTIEFLTRYDQSPLADYRIQIDQMSQEIGIEFVKRKDENGLKSKSSASLFNDIVLAHVNGDKKTETAIRNIVEFYEQLTICGDEKLCDQDVAKKYFQPDAKNFVDVVYPYICDQRKFWNDPNYASKLSVFARGSDLQSACGASQ